MFSFIKPNLKDLIQYWSDAAMIESCPVESGIFTFFQFLDLKA